MSESCSVMSNSLQPHGRWPARIFCLWSSSGKNTGVGSHSLFQGIFPTQRLNPGLLHCRQILYWLNHQGSPCSCQYHIVLVTISLQYCLKSGSLIPPAPLEVTEETKTGDTLWSTVPHIEVYPEKNMVWKSICTPMFIAVLFTKAKTWNQLKCLPRGE